MDFANLVPGFLMEFTFSADQEQFRDMVARFCRDKSPATEVRQLMEDERGFDPAVWQQLASELGVLGIHIAEDRGGLGFGAVELGIVMEEFGRSLMCAPYFASSVLAGTALAELGTPDQVDSYMPGLMDGTTIATLAVEERADHHLPDHFNTAARADGDNWYVSGHKPFVVDGHNADLLLVAAAGPDGNGLFAVQADSNGVRTTPQTTMDATRKLASVELSDAPAVHIGAPGADLTPIYNLASIALANEMVGGAQALLDSAVEYTKLRVQFGRPVGSFQAIKHRLADLLLEVEMAKSAAYQAAQAHADGERVSEFASLAKAAASEAYLQAAVACIQLHGGIGFTWENDTHLWFKRAKSSEVLLGTPAFHRERMLSAMGV